MTIQPQDNSLNYLIDPKSANVNRLLYRLFYLFCLFQEIITLIAGTLFHTIMYQMLKLKN